MKYIVHTFAGYFVLDENLNVVHFNENIKNLIDILNRIEDKEIIIEKNTEEFEKIKEKIKGIFRIESPSVAGDTLRKDLFKFLVLYAKYKGEDYAKEKLLKIAKKRCLEKVMGELSKRENQIVQCIRGIEDLDESINIIYSRLREWYSIYFPEIIEELSMEELITLFSETVDKKDIGKKLFFLSKEKRDKILYLKENSIGAYVEDRDLNMVKKVALMLKSMINTRKELLGHLEEIMKEVAPNLTEVAGVIVGAKLIATAGTLKKLAEMPSSTAQILGAQKAIFRHLSTGAKPPKHGLIFRSSYVSGAPKKIRGKMARTFANKITIAVREDVFGEKFIGDKLKKELETRLKELRENGAKNI